MSRAIRQYWTRHWHAVLDDELGQDASFDVEAAIADPSCDFRMHFDTWRLSDQAIRRCFGVLPKGNQMADRAISLVRKHGSYWTKPPQADDAACAGLSAGLKAIAPYLSDNSVLQKPIRLKEGTTSELAGGSFAPITEELDDAIFERAHERSGPEAEAALCFIHETVYRIYNAYETANYITWPLCSQADEGEPYFHFASFACSARYWSGVDDDGPLVWKILD